MVKGARWAAGGVAAERVSFTQLRRIFDRNRFMVLRVTAPTPGPLGVLLGAGGEALIFGSAHAGDTVRLTHPSGQSNAAFVLGGLRDLPLLLVRADPAFEDVPARPAADFPGPHGRVVRIGWGDDGPEPALGSVGRAPDAAGVARVDVPGMPGAPLFDGRGQLIGVSLDRRRIGTRVAAIGPRVEELRRLAAS